MGLGLGIVGTVFVSAIGHPASGGQLTVAEALIGNLVFDLGFVAAALYFANLHGRPAGRDFGFRRLGPVRVFAYLAGGGLVWGVYYLILWGYASVFSLHGTDKLPEPLGSTTSTAGLAGVAVFVCVVAPMAEEFFFRGFLFGVLRQMRVRVAGRDIGVWVAALVTGLLFGLAHAGSALSQDLVPLGLLGFILCLVRWWTGSLYPCMAIHAINNSIAIAHLELHWSVGQGIGLAAGSLAVISLLSLPLTRRSAAV
jgi:uncharacterized protein